MICSKKGQVLRRFPAMSEEKAEHFATAMRQLSHKAQSVVRDLDPPVSTLHTAHLYFAQKDRC